MSRHFRVSHLLVSSCLYKCRELFRGGCNASAGRMQRKGHSFQPPVVIAHLLLLSHGRLYIVIGSALMTEHYQERNNGRRVK